MRIVAPKFLFKFAIISINICADLESSAPVGSSANISFGFVTNAQNKGYLENYGKSVDVFEELQEHQPEAIQYAKERVERLTRDQVAVICRDSNPVTTVYELVEFLNSKRT